MAIPSDLSGLVAWWDASDAATLWTDTAGTTHATAEGAAVARWDDKSGNGFHFTQATSGNRPALNLGDAPSGENVLYFDGSNDSMQATTLDPSAESIGELTIYSVAKLDATAARTWSWVYGSTPTLSAAALMMGKSGSAGDAIHWGAPGWHNGINSAVTGFAGAWHVVGQIESDSAKTLRVDGSVILNEGNGASSLTVTNFYVGARAGTEPWIGPIVEIAIYNRALNSTERTDIEAYFNTKWLEAATEIPKLGLGAAAGAPAGAKVVEAVRAGLGAATAVAAGVETVTPPATVEKAALGAATAAASGSKDVQLHTETAKAGLGAAGAAATGTQVVAAAGEIAKAGLGAAATAAAGVQTTQLHVETVTAGLGAATAAAAGAQVVTSPTTTEKAGTAAPAGAPAGVQVVTPAAQHVKAATAVPDAVSAGWARITTGLLYAGSATGISGTWADTPNAVGASTGDYATWTNADTGTSAVLELATFGAHSVVPEGAPLDDVTITVRHSENPADQLASVVAQAYIGATPYGSAQGLTTSAAVHSDTIVIAGLTYEDLADLRVRITATRE